jgi:hypothetical protein
MTQVRTIVTSGSIPTTNQLALGDIAINTYDGKAYIKKAVGTTQTVLEIGAGVTPISASYALTASYATNFKVSGSITDVDYIDFDTTASVTQPSTARLSWNQADKTLDLGTGDGNTTLQIGQEIVYPPVVNKDSINLGEGTLVMVDPTDIAQGNRIRVVRAVTNGTYPSQYLVGVLTENIDINQEGFATWFGYVRNLSISTLETSGVKPVGETWVEGTVLFANPTVPGGFTYTQPAAPAVDATIAVITAINGDNLTLLVRPTLTITVGELNNVADSTTTGSYGDLFIKSGSVWVTGRQLTGSYGLTGSLTATSFTGSFTGSVNGAIVDNTAWTAYTPTWTAASVNPSIGNGTIEGYYKLIGKTCFVRGNIAMGSTTTFGSGEWYVGMPFTASHADAILMTANLLDNGTAWYNATVNGARAGFNYKSAIQYQATGGTANDVNSNQPFTWTNTDRFLWNGCYQIA